MDLKRYNVNLSNFAGSSLFMKTILLFFVFLVSLELCGQTVTTLDEYYGNWGDAGSWVGGIQPVPLYTDLNNQNITINGYINVGAYGIEQDLIVDTNSNDYDFIIEDTLVIYGDLEFKNDAMDLIVNGFLIVFGNVIFRNKVDVLSNGEIIVAGTVSFVGAQGTYSGDGNVYAGDINDTGRSNIPDDAEKTLDSLEDDYPDIYEFVQGGGQTPLPVEILYFTAEKENGGVNLSWATVREENFEYFTIERSADGYDFNELCSVEGRAEYPGTVTVYEFFDEMPLAGYSFYRLKATDVDGFSEYHGIISVRIESIAEIIRIYPNPVEEDKFTINFAGKNDTPYKLLSFNGSVLQQGMIGQGINEIYLTRKYSPGIYFIRLEKTGPYAPRKIIIR
jgi:hypothetical protein